MNDYVPINGQDDVEDITEQISDLESSQNSKEGEIKADNKVKHQDDAMKMQPKDAIPLRSKVSPKINIDQIANQIVERTKEIVIEQVRKQTDLSG